MYQIANFILYLQLFKNKAKMSTEMENYNIYLQTLQDEELLDELVQLNQDSPEDMTSDEVVNEMIFLCKELILSKMI